jgi:4-carboxymuconolactone decarboxylase
MSVDNRFDLSSDAMQVRREVLGDEYVDSSTEHADPLTREFQAFVTNYCWGEIWTDDRLSRVEHSLVVMAVTAALGRMREFEIHVRGALRNGLTPDQLTAVLRQIAVYAGVPAAVSALPSVRSAISDYERGELA